MCPFSSSSTAALDRKVKLPKYAQVGVSHVWLIDPEARTLDVLRLGRGGLWETVAVYSDDDRVRAEPFDAVELELGRLWPPRAP